MKFKLIFKLTLAWIAFIPLAILNGIIRNNFYQNLVGELPAHQLSTVIGSLLFFFYSYLIFKKDFIKLKIKTLFSIGLFWVILTIIFEFLFGHFIAGHSWSKLLYDYNIFKGRIWSLFLLNTIFTPIIINKHYK